MILILLESIFEDLFVVQNIFLDIYIRVLPAGNLVGMCSTFYPGMSNLLVTRFFCDFLLAETHISTFVVSRLRRIFILSVHEESDACLY